MKNPENKKINTYTKQFNPRRQSFTVPRNIVNCLVHVSLGRAKWAPYNAMGSNFSHNSLLISILSILTSQQAKCHRIENEKDRSFQIEDWQYLKKHFLYLLLSTSSINFSLPACPFVLFLIKKIFWITGQGYHHPHPKSCHQCNRVSGLSHLKQDIPSLTADFAPIRNCGPGNKR